MMPRRGQHRRDRRPVAGRDELDRRLGQARLAQAGDEAVVDRGRGVKALRPAAQDHRVAGLQAERAGVGGDVGAAFVDHADHPDGGADAPYPQARGHRPVGDRRAHRIGLLGHRAQPVGHRPDAAVVEPEPVQHRRTQALLLGKDAILGVGVLNLLSAFPDRLGGADEGGVFALGRGRCELGGGGAGGRSDPVHQRGNVGQVLHRPLTAPCRRGGSARRGPDSRESPRCHPSGGRRSRAPRPRHSVRGRNRAARRARGSPPGRRARTRR